jgi:hypothetical protein
MHASAFDSPNQLKIYAITPLSDSTNSNIDLGMHEGECQLLF